MAEERRRIGCGCLPLVVVFLIGNALLGAVDLPEDVEGILVPALVGIGILVAVVSAAVRRRQTSEAEDRAADGQPSPTEPARPAERRPPQETPQRRPPPPRTVPPPAEDLATQNLRKELKDAVKDLSEAKTQLPDRRLSSEEMIKRAKERLAREYDPDSR